MEERQKPDEQKPAAGTYDLDKEFRCNTLFGGRRTLAMVTRRRYEELPRPMAAARVDDATMQAIADGIHVRLLHFCEDDKQVAAAVLSGRDGAGGYMTDRVRGKYWEFMEQVAREHGMQYHDDGDGDGEKGASDGD